MKSFALRKAVVVLGLAGLVGFGGADLAAADTFTAPVLEKHRWNPHPNPVPCKLPPGHVCAGRTH